MQEIMNLKVKSRESFRPFAPCVLKEHAHEWFGMRAGFDSPYMLHVAPVLEDRRTPLSEEEAAALRRDPDLVRRVNVVRSEVPAVTHVDYSARVQTVDERHGRFQRLMKKFYEKTGCPILVNTSFNLSWEPIVQSPEDAYHTFMQSEIDTLVLGDFVVRKADQLLGFRPWNPGDADDPDSPWADPLTGEPLEMTPTGATNLVTGASYPVDEGIPRLVVGLESPEDGRDVTDVVKQFYEKTPFPNYDHLDNRRALIEKARGGLFGRLLNEQIPFDAGVVEIGCGTGQLTNFLSIAHRSVIGVDLCLNSLRLAQKFKTDNGLDRATFAQMNLFHPALRRGFFDVVISNGVLHSTSDCRKAFRTISGLAKPGGYVVVGLYSAYSRRLHQARVVLYRLTGVTNSWLDPQFGRIDAGGKHEAWFQDQYCHPHETLHSIGELLGWMEESGLEFVNSIPKPVVGPVLTPDEQLFASRDPCNPVSRFLSQMADMGNGYREGGFFIVIARRQLEHG
jgi:SAM-dependent methyltransferase